MQKSCNKFSMTFKFNLKLVSNSLSHAVLPRLRRAVSAAFDREYLYLTNLKLNVKMIQSTNLLYHDDFLF